jgi:hypothetical protein
VLAAHDKRRRRILPQHFTVERFGHLLRNDEADLVLRQQPAYAVFFTGNAFVFTKGLAPPPEVSGIAIDYPLDQHCRFFGATLSLVFMLVCV